ncbi:hypothetical protein CMQ_4800 [Grosmannia clavigera kw1407]|uniref:Uncharacterized protein n=1 Tax=Grosmannia clavigera (strain kw1407 / UAMH 11150) TaxID=655863 RepID=F0XU43_GROCL|nr:uncharacterized protein CMQ_4800 [Grosmannia clavigera kw1407]EFW98948.1 hypothetical protein CMQ_4800 [Grosmannia clavigera kw1407]
MEPTLLHNKLTKSKGKMVKPILKKLSHSEKNSLDLDRPWEEQQALGLGVSGYDLGSPTRSVRDVSFTISEKIPVPSKTRYQHVRSPSGASHVSVASTASGGGPRPSTFVHPFQQTPRTQSPPMAFAGSLTALDKSLALNTNGISSSGTRDYSPTITENEDDDEYPPSSLPRSRHFNRATSASQPSGRTPSLAAQRAASFTDISAAPLPSVITPRSVPNGHSRRGHGSSGLASSLSHSDLHLNSTGTVDSPTSLGPTLPASLTSLANSGTNSINTSTGSNTSTPLSPLRSSLESVGFPRLRSRSELYIGDRSEQIREARRKFEERERAKAEKHDREMLRKRERRDHKEAKEIERQSAAQFRKNSGDGLRPSLSRKTTPTFGTSSGNARGSSDQGHRLDGIKHGRVPPVVPAKPLAFKSSNYDNMMGGTTPSFGPTVEGVAFKNTRRSNTAKRRTQGYWHEFILWLRTRLFRLGRK